LDKTEEADGKTPEGVYYVAAKNASSMFGVDPK
jgi:murein L,D-transpeptidase YafK